MTSTIIQDDYMLTLESIPYKKRCYHLKTAIGTCHKNSTAQQLQFNLNCRLDKQLSPFSVKWGGGGCNLRKDRFLQQLCNRTNLGLMMSINTQKNCNCRGQRAFFPHKVFHTFVTMTYIRIS